MYVVAGASGRVGSAVARSLIDAGERVGVLLRDESRAKVWQGLGARVWIGQLQDAELLHAALVEAKGFFVLLPPNYRIAEFLVTQRRLADSVGAAVRRSKVPHVALLSSAGADLPNGTGPIQVLHHFERVLRDSGTVLSAFRSSYFQDNVVNALGPAERAGVFPAFAPDADRAFPHVATQDVGRFIAAALRSPPASSEAIDVLGPSYSHREVADHLARALRKSLQVAQVPRERWVFTLAQARMSEAVATLFVEMYDALSSGLLTPRGDRSLLGDTQIEETIQLVLARQAAVPPA